MTGCTAPKKKEKEKRGTWKYQSIHTDAESYNHAKKYNQYSKIDVICRQGKETLQHFALHGTLPCLSDYMTDTTL